ncbi:MAG TPA: alpha/beta hydrolase [Actinoplanes sp.]|nr:alpha/beta hydrolase [Actinoplanes sp.]
MRKILIAAVSTVAVAALALPGVSEAAAGRLDACRGSGPKVTVVLVHGAWADTSSWSGEVSRLQKAGCQVRSIANPVENLTTDSQYVADFLKSVKGPVVLAGHSYGGSVITNASALVDNVKALVYVDAAAPAVGETNGSLSGADSILSTLPASQLFDTTSYPGAPAGQQELYLKENIFVNHFGSSLPKQQARLLWAAQRGASTEAFGTPSKYAGWKTIPSWYFISSGDQIITPTSERAMAKRAKSKVTVYQGGSHLTLISDPQPVTDVIVAAIRSVRR